MMYTVTIQLTDQEARVLRSYASVGRWFDSLTRFLDKISNLDIDLPGDIPDDISDIEEQIKLLKQPLSGFHYQARQQITFNHPEVKPLWRQLPYGGPSDD